MEDIYLLFDGKTYIDFSKVNFIRLNYYKDIIEIGMAENICYTSASDSEGSLNIPMKFQELINTWVEYKKTKQPLLYKTVTKMARLDKEREQELQPKRMEYACSRLHELGINYMADNTKVCFQWKGSQVTLFAYSGWFTGKTITDGRGIDNLLKQLK